MRSGLASLPNAMRGRDCGGTMLAGLVGIFEVIMGASRLAPKPRRPCGFSAYWRCGHFFSPNKKNLEFLITSQCNTRS